MEDNKITKISQNSLQINLETTTNENDKKCLKRYLYL